MTLEQRQESYRLGLEAEEKSVRYFEKKNLHLVAARTRNAAGEIDLIVANASLIVFVEVKARKKAEDGLYSLQKKQQQRIVRAASLFLATHPEYTGLDVRFDLMVIAKDTPLTHVEQAFDASDLC